MKLPWYLKASKPYEKNGKLVMDLTFNRFYIYWTALLIALGLKK